MNVVCISGRVVRKPEVKYSASGTAMGKFNLAIDRGKDKDGNDRGADFPSVVCFGKTAELAEKYLDKGSKVGISGRLQTGTYEKNDGTKVYTTDVVADRLDFFDTKKESKDDVPEGFSRLEEQIPFR